jgi:hypothetical protein
VTEPAKDEAGDRASAEIDGLGSLPDVRRWDAMSQSSVKSLEQIEEAIEIVGGARKLASAARSGDAHRTLRRRRCKVCRVGLPEAR